LHLNLENVDNKEAFTIFAQSFYDTITGGDNGPSDFSKCIKDKERANKIFSILGSANDAILLDT